MTLRANILFATASLLPAGLLIAGAMWGGAWSGAALICMTVLVLLMDRLGPAFEASAALMNSLPRSVALMHFAVLGGTLWAVGQTGHLAAAAVVAQVLAAGLFAGQVANACAHELIHRRDRQSRLIGTAIYCTLLNGQHVSAHLLVHHVHAGTREDPNSAPLGQGFYRYAWRTAMSEFRAGWQAETRRRPRGSALRHPYAAYLAGAAASLAAAAALGGLAGLAALLAIAIHAQLQLLLSDYVQHYGLRRVIRPDGRPEPMGPQHSWNAPQPWSAALMLNAPRHSDHHMNPARPFPDLQLDPGPMPTLPRSVPAMAALALCPPLWRRVMDPRARRWSGVDARPENLPDIDRTLATHA